MELTVRELKRELTKWSDDTEIVFGGTPTAEFVFSHFARRLGRALGNKVMIATHRGAELEMGPLADVLALRNLNPLNCEVALLG